MTTTLRLGDVLRAAQSADPSATPDVVLKVATQLGATDAVVYLVDFAQTTLEPLPDRSTHADIPRSEVVESTMAGKAFAAQQTVTAEREEGVRVWVPIVEGSDRTGVLALTLPSVDDEVLRGCEELGLFVGYLIATQSRSTDLFNLHRRRRSLSLGASMQWDLLPPLVLKTERLTVAALLEPAYEVAGDCFDYALNAAILDLAVFDPMGHGMTSALMAALCIGSYRHDRREGQSLEQIDLHLEASVTNHFPECFVTGQLVRVDLDTGSMTWINAGHPLPMLIRNGQVIQEIEAPADLPWGMGRLAGGRVAVPTTVSLEPGDSILFYTDGVVEARMPDGEQFGTDRLADLAGQHASDELEPEEFVRRLVRAVVEHQEDTLADDATLVLIQWHGNGR